MLATALQIAGRKVSAPMPGSEDGRRMAWGKQLDTAVVADADNGRRRAAAYLAKYATKGSDEHGVLDHRLRSALPDDATAGASPALWWRRRGTSGTTTPSLTSGCSSGPTPADIRGHFLTKSRRYSTTFEKLRGERQRWWLATRGHAGSEWDPSGVVVDVAEWEYEGSGYPTAGDVTLARNLEDGLRAGRNAFREDEGSGPASSRTRESDASDRFRMSEGRS